MNEVDTLEREMVSCQEQLQLRNVQCKEYKERANDAESRLEEATSTANSAAEDKQRLEDHDVTS